MAAVAVQARRRIVAMTLVAAAAVFAGGCGPDKNWVRKPPSKIPFHPEFQVMSTHKNEHRAADIISYNIRSKASFAEVKAFYLRELGPQGFKLTKEEALTHDGSGRGARQMVMDTDHERVRIIYNGVGSRFEVPEGNYYMHQYVKKTQHNLD